jgi:hypothetical protein
MIPPLAPSCPRCDRVRSIKMAKAGRDIWSV